jgi:hypothetical protein
MSTSESGGSGGGGGGGAEVCDVCGGPATARCARCRGVWYCGPKCQRAAWGAHKLACAAAVAAAAAAASATAAGAAAGASESVAGGGTVAGGAPSAAATGTEGEGGGTGGLGAGTLRGIAAAVAQLASRKSGEQAAGAVGLAEIASAAHDNNRKMTDFQTAVVAAGGIPLLVRVLKAQGRNAERAVVAASVVLEGLAAYNPELGRTIGDAGAVPPLVALLDSHVAELRRRATSALRCLSAACGSAIVAAGGIPPLLALLSSLDVQAYSLAALSNMASVDNASAFTGVAVRSVPRIVALLASPTAAVWQAAVSMLYNLSRNDAIKPSIVSAASDCAASAAFFGPRA